MRASLPESKSPSHELVPFSAEVSGLGVASLALGAWSMVNSKVIGLRSILEGAVRLSEIASNPTARKWAGPILGVVALGAVAYVIYELPRSIPRNVGRHLQATLLISSGVPGTDAELVPFVEAQSSRISKEVRKVMRLAAWELRERHRGAVDARAEVVRQSEETERRSARALAYFKDVDRKVEELRELLGEKM